MTYTNDELAEICDGFVQKDVTPVHLHWGYIFFALTHWYSAFALELHILH